MRQQSDTRQAPTDGLPNQGPPGTRPELVDGEDIHIRNYDHQWGYDLTITAQDDDGEVVFEKRYYLPSGRTVSELDVLPSGEYEVVATLDNLKEETLRCRIDDGPEQSILIEIGNGAFSLTEGLNA